MGPICGYCKKCKKKPNGYYGNYMRVLQGMLLKPNGNHGLICWYCKRCQINQQLLWDLYAGIAYLKISL